MRWKKIQAALVIRGLGIRGLGIRGLGIRGFNYSWVRKQGKTANSKGIFIILSLKQRFWYSRIQISQERNRRE